MACACSAILNPAPAALFLRGFFLFLLSHCALYTLYINQVFVQVIAAPASDSTPMADCWSWRDVPRSGQPCAGFIALKTPLPTSDALEAEHHFTPSMFVERQVAHVARGCALLNLTRAQTRYPHVIDCRSLT